ncbi:polysaccharide lyase family 1 protein [Pelomonas sp. Root1444]|uniref:pectate lyase family protein n=1 Tax=Pelomonas sp. Root1444 TaxID=1736464 RepID=UPI0009E826B0|nr:pectate lyase [Pelomonas sp. Root1444]
MRTTTALATALLLAACGTPPAPAGAKAPPAFPGAEGEGAISIGGRGGRAIYVTTLADHGPGSLRDAIEADGPRTVVFAVSGTIALAKPLHVKNGRITIAGQTAPGDGITLRNHPLLIDADDVVVRFIRSRLGDEAGADDDAISVGSGQRIILDHVSASWSTDEALSVSVARADLGRPAYQHVTVQWSVIAESLNCNAPKKGACHGFGSLLRGAHGTRLSMHHNLWVHHQDRMPRPGNYLAQDKDRTGGFYDIRANVFYNWGTERAGYNLDRNGERASYNFVGNVYLRGPDSKGAFAFEESNPGARAFFAGNTMDGRLPADPWALVRAHAQHLPGGLPDGYKLAAPLPFAHVGVDAPDKTLEHVLAGVGASLARDAVDQRHIADVRQRRGKLINSQSEVGGWPVLQSKPAPLDSDGDGMPDAWETGQGLNPRDASDAARVDPATGYTQLERYLNGLVAHLPGTMAAARRPDLAFVKQEPYRDHAESGAAQVCG